MDTLDFLGMVLPDEGFIVTGAQQAGSGGRTWIKFTRHADLESAASMLEAQDAAGFNVYFGVNSFGDWYMDEEKGKKRIRTQDNVVACRALFDDFDVSDKAGTYNSKEEALDGIITLYQALRLSPTIVDSGGGYHAYVHLEQDCGRQAWDRLASAKRAVIKHLGVKADPAVNGDSARILRPVGTHNHKHDPASPVTLVRQGKTYSLDRVSEALQEYLDEHGLEPAPTGSGRGATGGGKAQGADNPFAAALDADYPDSHADTVADKCAVIGEFRDEEGNILEPHWHRAIGVLKYCVDGEDAIHEWSKGYSGYTEAETQEKIDNWEAGPTTCEEMDSILGCKKDCPFAGKCSSPVQLGYGNVRKAAAQPAPKAGSAPQTGQVLAGRHIPHWPTQGYDWVNDVMKYSSTNKDGIVEWRTFSLSLVYPIDRIRDVEGVWHLRFAALEKNGDWREFDVPTEKLASPMDMAKALSAHEVYLDKHRGAALAMASFVEAIANKLQQQRVMTETVDCFGWDRDRTRFIIGTCAVTSNGEDEILCDPNKVPSDIATDYGRKGTLEEWVANIDLLYNRPGAEPCQFALCHAMGSPLVELMGSSNWHGIPLAFTGPSGTGKSTLGRIACGFFGNPRLMERQGGGDGTTINALIKRIAVTGGLPLLIDEFSGRTPDELTRTGYALANGRDKERLSTSGGFSTTGAEWFKNSFITSNDSIVDHIASLKGIARIEATQLRFFEVPLPEGYVGDVFNGIDSSLVEAHQNNVYGEACRPYLQFIIQNRDWVRRQLAVARAKLDGKGTSDERFYRDCIATAWVAAKIAEKLGLIHFDVTAMKNWAMNSVLTMRKQRFDTNTNIKDCVDRFLSSLSGRLLWTEKKGSKRPGKKIAHHRADVEIRKPEMGRVIKETREFYITVWSLRDWCKENVVSVKAMIEEMQSTGKMKHQVGGTPYKNLSIGVGMEGVPGGQQKCYELDFDKLISGNALSVVTTASDPIGDADMLNQPQEQ